MRKCEHGDADRTASGQCRICKRARAATPEYKAKSAAYEQRPEVKAAKRARAATPERKAYDAARNAMPEVKAAKHARKLDVTYGEGAAEWYAARLAAQGYRCDNRACRKTVAENGRALALDHDHGCHYCDGVGCRECWRSILCSSCNATAHHMLSIELVAGLLAIMREHRATVEARADLAETA